MEVTDIKKVCSANAVTVTVVWSGHRDLEMCLEGVDDVLCPGDLVLMSVLGEAMGLNEDIVIADEFPVSESLIVNLDRWQQYLMSWYPNFSKVNIRARTIDDRQPIGGACSLFSGGIDSFYTLMQCNEEIDSLLFCLGMDIQLSEEARAAEARTYYAQLAQDMGKNLIIATTNIRHVFTRYTVDLHALVFAAFAIATGFKRLYIPASHDKRELFPWGSHLLTDPLLSNGTTEVIHHGATLRSEKIRYLAQNDLALKYMRVCNAENSYNCGSCEKCLRTMFALAAVNASSSTIPDLKAGWKTLSNLKIYRQNQYHFWLDNLELAKQCQDRELVQVAQRICSSYRFRRWLREGLSFMRAGRGTP